MTMPVARFSDHIDSLPAPPAVPAPPADAEAHLVAALRRGDEAAFVTLVQRYHGLLIRLALGHVRSHAVAEEVVQETWIGVLQGIATFEGRASVKTWICRILMNQAKRRGAREQRTVPFSDLMPLESGDAEPAVDPDRFYPAGHRIAGHWAAPVREWEPSPEDEVLSAETRARIERVIAMLSPVQQQVITMRDIEGWSSADVCNVLGITETNQRVLLHRARAKVRQSLEDYYAGTYP